MVQGSVNPPLVGVVKNIRRLLQRQDLTRSEQKRYESELDLLVKKLLAEENTDTLEAVSHEFQVLFPDQDKILYWMLDHKLDPSPEESEG